VQFTIRDLDQSDAGRARLYGQVPLIAPRYWTGRLRKAYDSVDGPRCCGHHGHDCPCLRSDTETIAADYDRAFGLLAGLPHENAVCVARDQVEPRVSAERRLLSECTCHRGQVCRDLGAGGGSEDEIGSFLSDPRYGVWMADHGRGLDAIKPGIKPVARSNDRNVLPFGPLPAIGNDELSVRTGGVEMHTCASSEVMVGPNPVVDGDGRFEVGETGSLVLGGSPEDIYSHAALGRSPELVLKLEEGGLAQEGRVHHEPRPGPPQDIK
jgi:hypothetical protein